MAATAARSPSSHEMEKDQASLPSQSLQPPHFAFEVGEHRIHADTRLIIAGSRSLRLSQWILNKISTIKIDGDHETAQLFITYLQSGKIDLTPDNVRNVYAMARRYDARELRQRCQRYLAQQQAMWSLTRSLDRGWRGVLNRLENMAAWWGTLSLHMHGFHSAYVDTKMGRVHMFEAEGQGSGPPVLVLHGLSSRATDYASLLRALVRVSRRVIAPDFPGHGLSDRHAIKHGPIDISDGLFEALDKFLPNKGPFAVIGNSMGGFAATRFASLRPDDTCALILSSPAGAPMETHDVESLMNTFRIESRAEAVTFLERLFANRPWYIRFLAEAVRAHFMDPELCELLTHAHNADFLSTDELARVRHIPTWLSWGQQERILPLSHLDFFCHHLPNAVVDRPDGIGHFPLFDDAPRFSRYVADIVTCLGTRA